MRPCDHDRSQEMTVADANRRLALFSPLPPQMSGIATYTSRLTADLRKLCDVTVFVGAEPAEVEAPPGVRVENVARFATLNADQAFDANLFFMGNSHYHVAMLDVLKQHRGSVLFHDVRLTGLYEQVHHYTPHLLTDGSVGATVRHFYPNRYCDEVERMSVIPAETADQHGVFMSREAVQRADQVLVHSRHAAELLRTDADVDASIVYPLPCPEIPTGPAHQVSPSDANGSPVLASFGIVAPIKQPELLIKSLALLSGRLTGARLRFVGAIDEPYRADLQTLANDCGVGERVEFTGHLPDAEFTEAQRSAGVALQLRAFSNGESSACVTELLALGVPTIVTAIGSMNELPDGGVAKVAVDIAPTALADLLYELTTDADQRRRLQQQAQHYAEAHSFAIAADSLVRVLFD